MHFGDPGHDVDVVPLAQQFAGDRAGGDAAGRLARARSPPTAPIAKAVLRVVGVVGVAGTVLLSHLVVVARALPLVGNEEAEGCAQRLPLERAAEDAHGVRLLALG